MELNSSNNKNSSKIKEIKRDVEKELCMHNISMDTNIGRTIIHDSQANEHSNKLSVVQIK